MTTEQTVLEHLKKQDKVFSQMLKSLDKLGDLSGAHQAAVCELGKKVSELEKRIGNLEKQKEPCIV